MTQSALPASQAPPLKEFLLHGLTARGLIYGTLFSIVMALADPYIYMVCSGLLAANATPVGAVFIFAIAVFVFNMGLRGLDNLFGGGTLFGVLKMSSSELVVVYIMVLVTLAIPTLGFTESFIAVLTGPAHFATDTNNWNEKVLPHLNPDILPFDVYDEKGNLVENSTVRLRRMATAEKGVQDLEPNHIKWLYEGMPDIEGKSFTQRVRMIPWRPWLKPFAIWMVMIFAVYFACLCLVSLLRRQWIERERLQYPLVQLPMAMVEEADAPKGIPAFFRSKLLWAGFAVPAFLVTWNQLAHFYQLIPAIQTTREYTVLSNSMNVSFALDLPIIGFTYLIKLDVALSLWFFCIVGGLVGAAFSNLGIKAGSNDMWLWRGQTHPWTTHACFGAVLVLGLMTLWSARRSLGAAARKAFGGGRDVDDSNEIVPHKVAFWGLFIALGIMVAWMCRYTGMDPGWAIVTVIVSMLGLLAATRLIAEGGLVFVQFPMMVQSFLFRTAGQSTLGPANLLGLSWTGVWVGDIRVIMMPAFANSTRLADHVKLRQRSLLWLFAIAIVVGIAASTFSVLYVGYTRGGEKTDSWIFGAVGKDWFGSIAAENIPTTEQARQGQRAGDEYSVSRVWASGAGAAFFIFLAVMRARFLWWPFHPLGFPFAVMPAMDRMWFAVAVGWAVKAVILRYGGAVLFRKLKPFFFGLILGEFVTAGLWYVFYFVSVTWFHGTGNCIYD